ncbi:transcriptional regulator [Scopulibacillus darangshiensis]|uniref:Transcriptional regulator n=1 Tax=Scopulibacillus darangshiensis TaxID=442528 RepID=A0A4R2PCD9_9BACL|nr:helix-turn-helix domain-containing protein [Scopulibacillus darangshiensis]TCP31751.1 transcriptional regulator [Scopulibacillus darangshiensis]
MLQKFGFSQYESQVYEVLASSIEPLDTTMIVRHSGVPKAKIYEVLARLTDKGMVMDSVSDKKKVYAALPLNLVVEKLTKEFQSDIEKLKAETVKRSFADDRVWSLKVDTSIRAQCKQLIEHAEKSIRLSAWNDDFIEYQQLLEEKESEGLFIETLVVGEISTSLKNCHKLIPNEQHDALERFQLIIIDDLEIIFTGLENQSWQAMMTKSPSFVKFFTEFFYHDVALATITSKYYDLFMNDEEIKQILMKLKY